jgi:adenylosuccinate synthase
MVDVILGLQWGDEGKGKIVDYFAPNYDVVARFQGGPNAGHTLYVNDKKVVLHQIPSGVFHENKINLVGNGVVLDAVTFKRECETVATKRHCSSANVPTLFYPHTGHWIKQVKFQKALIKLAPH